jgi:hypothetical protein
VDVVKVGNVLAVLGFVLACSTAMPAAQENPISQKDLAERIATGTLPAKDTALLYVLAIPANRREPVLEEALINELERLNEKRLENFRRLRAEEPTEHEGEGPGEYRLAVTQAVAESSNPNVIPALVGALGSGIGVSRALAKFGDASVAPLAAVARIPHPDHGTTSDALKALQIVLEGGKPLSSTSRAQILTVASERLAGTQHFLHVAAAVDLAIATGDSSLRRRVELLASDPAQLRLTEINDPKQQKYVRDAAGAALNRSRRAPAK